MALQTWIADKAKIPPLFVSPSARELHATVTSKPSVIGLDTNVVVRYVAQNDPRQSAAEARLFERTLSVKNPGFVSAITLREIAWVLSESYGTGRDRIREVIEGRSSCSVIMPIVIQLMPR